MQRKNGYTLVEILVGLSIMAIVFTVGFASYRDFSRRQNLSGVAKELKADLRSLQQLALIGQKPDSVSCPTLNGYVFKIVDNQTYTLSASCVNSLGANVDYETEIVDLSLKSVTISATASNINFKVLGQGTNLSATNTITLTQPQSGNTIMLTVGVGGDVL